MKAFVKEKRLSLILLVVLFLLLIILGFQTNFIKNFKLTTLLAQSFVEISKDQNNLKFDFQINPSEEEATEFLNNLGIKRENLNNLSLELDQSSADRLSNNLPLKLKLSFNPKSLSFQSLDFQSLRSSFGSKEYNFATESGKLYLKVSEGNDLEAKIEDPLPLLRYASSSGQLNLSSKLNDLMPILERIATMDISISGKSVIGEITLK